MLGLAIACLLAIGVSACSGPDDDTESEGASCVGQVFTVTPTSVPVTGSITVHGQYYLERCEDVVEEGSPDPTAGPMTDVPLMLSSTSGESREIARFDATGDLGEITSSVTLPKDVKAGAVRLRLGDADEVTVTVTS